MLIWQTNRNKPHATVQMWPYSDVQRESLCFVTNRLAIGRLGKQNRLFQRNAASAFWSSASPHRITRDFPFYLKDLELCTMAGSGEVQSKVMETQEWVKRWDERAIGFHKTHIHPLLEKHAPTMFNGRTGIKIFFPLCGKALDMKWLADQGHTVIGVEAAQKAIEEFFDEQKVTFTSQPAPAVDGTLFQSEDKKLQLYCCDFYKFSGDVAGKVDGIWDRGALVAINNQDREKYAAIMKSMMAPGCRYLVSALQYDETKYGGPPHHLGDESVMELYGKEGSVKPIDDTDAFEPKHAKWGLDWMREKIFLISPK